MTDEHPFLATIKRYYDGCNHADFDMIRATFTDDVVHYFTHAPVIHGGDALANFWARVVPHYGNYFTVDHGIVQGDEAVIEWSLELTPKPGAERELIRGAEWYVFRDDRIAEIRAYYLNRHDPIPATNFELRDYPYSEREYYMLGSRAPLHGPKSNG
jgi:hypothetical protein